MSNSVPIPQLDVPEWRDAFEAVYLFRTRRWRTEPPGDLVLWWQDKKGKKGVYRRRCDVVTDYETDPPSSKSLGIAELSKEDFRRLVANLVGLGILTLEDVDHGNLMTYSDVRCGLRLADGSERHVFVEGGIHPDPKGEEVLDVLRRAAPRYERFLGQQRPEPRRGSR